MDLIRLPALPPTTSTESALDILRTSNRSGLVTTHDDETRLITARRLKRALHDGVKRLSEVQDFVSLPALAVAAVPYYGVRHGVAVTAGGPPSLGAPHEGYYPGHPYESAVVSALPPGTEMYYLVGYEAGTAFVLTRSESAGRARGTGPRTCSCSGEFEHEVDESELLPGRLCPHCLSSVSCRR